MALWRDGAVAAVSGTDPRSHAERLPLEAVAWLAGHQVTLQDIDTFVIVAGPGSFTGLRVGVAAVQGWAFATGRPVAAVPTLDAVVRSVGDAASAGAVIVPCIDGHRGEVFFGAWPNGAPAIEASVGRPEDVIAEVRALAGEAPIVVSGDGAAKYADVWTTAGWRIVAPLMTLAEAAVRMAADGRAAVGPPHAARPIYGRRPDAEIVRERAGRQV
jgi:tRNA threonylcarbamoyladenosine biosynthesis protein TsaB